MIAKSRLVDRLIDISLRLGRLQYRQDRLRAEIIEIDARRRGLLGRLRQQGRDRKGRERHDFGRAIAREEDDTFIEMRTLAELDLREIERRVSKLMTRLDKTRDKLERSVVLRPK